MWLDFVLACIHHLLVFAIVVMLAIEIVTLKPGADSAAIRKLGRVDAAYGALAGAVVIVGFLRAIYGLKGWDYYATNPLFWAKVGAFLIVGLLSIMPTIRFLQWNARLKADPTFLPATADIKRVRPWLHAEAAVLTLIPIIAAGLARGILD